MLVVGLTGGVGCGKSTVAERMRALGVPVIDADDITRELSAPGSPVLAQIIDRFGPGVLRADGTLDRQALRRRIFSDAEGRRHLEALLHPEVAKAIRHRVELLAHEGAPYCLVVVPLLIESGMEDLVDRILVVECTEPQQLERVSRRDGCRPEEVQAIIASQATPQQRCGKADEIIENRGSILELIAQVDAMHRRYLRLARERYNMDGCS